MPLIISKTEPYPYTIAEIMDEDYRELWERVCKQEARLASLQGNIVKALPEWKHRLANTIEELAESRDAQLDLQYYTTLRALYLFVYNVWCKYCIGYKRPYNLYDLCDKLTDTPKGEDSDTENDLTKLLSKLEDVSFEALLNRGDSDVLNRLAEIVEQITHDVVSVVPNWSLRDITETNDLCHPDLLPSALVAEDFANVNIGEIAADDKLKRIY